MMRVLKRNGDEEDVSFDKVLNRIKLLSTDIDVNVFEIAQKVCSRIYDGVKTSELDELAAHLCSSMLVEHPDYGKLASRIIVSNHHKNTSPSFSEAIHQLHYNTDQDGEHCSLISEELYETVMKNKEKLNSYIDYSRDYYFDYFGFKTLERSYLLKVNGKVVERPQHMWMRVALGIHGNDFKDALHTYDMMSKKYFTHATPTLFNAGTKRPQCSSCFVAGTKVYTDNGVKSIEDVKIGDRVMTHENRYQPVSQLHVNDVGNRTLFDFKAYMTPSITATENHAFMSMTKEQIEWGQKPQWNELKALRVGDFIEIPKYEGGVSEQVVDLADFAEKFPTDGHNIKYEYQIEDERMAVYGTWRKRSHLNNAKGDITFRNKSVTFNRYWKIDANFCKFLGVWYGDGHVVKGKNSKGVMGAKGIGITIDKRNEDLITFCSEYGKSLFGTHVSIHTMKKQNVMQVLFNCTFIGKVFQHLFGDSYAAKKLYTQAHSWSKELIEHFLCGLVCADGFVTKCGYVRVAMCNQQFVRDVYNLSRSRGILVSYVESSKKYNYKEKGLQSYTTSWMTIPRESAHLANISKTYTDDRLEKFAQKPAYRYMNVMFHEGRTFVRIMSKRPSDIQTTTVYNIGVEEDHSYMVDGLIAKNCYLQSMNSDSIVGIFQSLTEVAQISKYSGGIGIHMHQVRAKGSRIRGTNGVSDGIVPMLRVFNNTARYVNQSGKRNGSVAVYMEPWHADIEAFLELRKNHGNEEERCRDLFLALWVPDLFMERVRTNGKWSLMCPDRCPGLSDVFGEEFVRLYTQYEAEGKFNKQVNAQDLWFRIMEAQIETGVPYICYKDAANKKSNQQNIGVIKSSNLCVEIMEVSTPDEIAVCNLASICLPSYVTSNEDGTKMFDFESLHSIAKTITKNLNKVIDRNFYPIEKSRISNLRHRPIGIGVQGLADVFMMLRLPFESAEATELNKRIFETIYHGAMESSMEIAKKRHETIAKAKETGMDVMSKEFQEYLRFNEFDVQIIDSKYPGAYTTFEGCPASQGKFQFDLWGKSPIQGRYDWDKLKQNVMQYGIRNSLLVAPMPTASTAQIMGFNESFEPFTSNIFKRKTLSGEFIVVNKYLIDDLIKSGLWSKNMKDLIIANEGSIQGLKDIPKDLQELYKTAWEIKQKHVLDMSADRGIYICQSQSLNIFMEDADFKKLTSMHFYGWERGLKTGSYYIRTRPRAKTQQFTIDPRMAKQMATDKTENTENTENTKNNPAMVCTEDVCLMCSG